ncbi:DUF3443 domain-containing protein [Burkholderia ubonensis]|uniref:DUF3443 domain-containing protein n=1 Tax=Burkholderia ubonensis TaxID=101571 RepID=UPI0009B439DA|nr:DUF3443 domain-containing protein [Burkholderia ubonensis]
MYIKNMNIVKNSMKLIGTSIIFLFLAGCGDSTNSTAPDASTSPSTGGLTPPSPIASANVVPVIVGIGAAGAPNIVAVSVRVCVPGSTTQCQTIDNIQVDTQSSGLRIFSTALAPQIASALPVVNVAEGQLAECLAFASGYTWGSIRLADLKIGGESAASLPIHIIADLPDATIPASCSENRRSENTVAAFGANGVLGVAVSPYDCDTDCSADTQRYYACTGDICSATAVPRAQQIPNPVTRFPVDNNGVILKLDAVPDSGAASVNGTLTFGIGTQSNNALTAAQTVYTTDASGKLPNSLYYGMPVKAFLDSGTSTLSLYDSTLTPCPVSIGATYFCPTTTQVRSVTLVGQKGETGIANFKIANAQTLFDNPSDYAFNDLASTGEPGAVNIGLPFFFGRTVYSGIDQTESGGAAPFVAF